MKSKPSNDSIFNGGGSEHISEIVPQEAL